MRQCIFVLGTRAQLVEVAPVLQLAKKSRLRHTVWFTGQNHESIDDAIRDLELTSVFVLPKDREGGPGIGKRLVWLPSTIYRCLHYIGGVKTWTTKRPLVIVLGDTLSTWLGAVAGHWGGGDVVHLDSGLSSGKWWAPFPQELLRRLTHRNVRYAFCPTVAAATRMRRYLRCIVEVSPLPVQTLLRLAGGHDKNQYSNQGVSD